MAAIHEVIFFIVSKIIMRLSSSILVSLLFAIASGCKSIPEKVRINKEKFVQVGKENSKPVDVSNLNNIYEQAQANNVEGKMKYLGVDKIQTVFGYNEVTNIQLDSVVIFTKSDYEIIYDFATIERSIEILDQKSGLKNFEKIDDRLFLGRK